MTRLAFPPLRAFAAAAVALLVAGCGSQARQAPDPFRASGELVALSGAGSGPDGACISCHGLDGLGDGGGSPRLAGLDAGYLQRQLDDYAIGRRIHPQMQHIAKALAPADRQSVSFYYAAMTPPALVPAAAPAPANALWVAGDPARGLPACAACHGALGEGMGPGNPPLAGQSAGYLAEQMRLWREGKRRGDAAGVMQVIARRLTPAESEAVSAYASALTVPAPHQESPEASPSERRADPRNDASGPPPRAAAPAR